MATTLFKVPVKVAAPTRNHRPAVWECMLGTVYALNDAGECRYFDYDHAAALAFAGVDVKADNRSHRVTRLLNFQYVKSGAIEGNPNVGKLVLWVPKAVKPAA
jgi:hypothetical protein